MQIRCTGLLHRHGFEKWFFNCSAADSAFQAIAGICILEGISDSKVKRKYGKWKCLLKTLLCFNVHLRLPIISNWEIVSNVKTLIDVQNAYLWRIKDK